MKGITILWLFKSIFLPGARPQNCENIGWKGDHVNILDDCSIFEENVTIFLTRVLDRQDCVNKVTLEIEGYSGHRTLNSKHYGNFGRGKWILTNEIKPKDRCEKVKLQLWIESLHYGSRYQSYPDSFYSSSMLDPKNCFKIEEDLTLTTNKTQEVIITLSQGVFKLKACLLNLTIHNSTSALLWQYQPCSQGDPTCEDNWNNTVKLTLSRCSNQTLTVTYKFVSGQKAKILNVPEDKHACRAEQEKEAGKGAIFDTKTIAGIGGVCALAVILSIMIALGVCMYKKRQRAAKAEEMEMNKDINDVYGTYGVCGEGDYNIVEDNNPYYETGELED